MDFDFKAAIQARPRGDTRQALVQAFGDPLQGEETRTGNGQFEPVPAFLKELVWIPASDLPGFPPYGDQQVKKIRLHRKVAPVFKATWAVLYDLGLHTRLRVYSGATVFRHMLWDYKNPVSLHAYGVAIDFDAPWNGYDLPPAKIQMDMDVVEVFERLGWHWGGWWDPTDAMHFQWTDPLPRVPVKPWQDQGLAGFRPRKPIPGKVPAEPAPAGLSVELRDPAGKMVPEPVSGHYQYGGKVIRHEGSRLSVGNLALAVLGDTQADIHVGGLHVNIDGTAVQIERAPTPGGK